MATGEWRAPTSRGRSIPSAKRAPPRARRRSLGKILSEKVAKIGEKISFRRFARFETPAGTPGMVVSYIHAGGKIGVIVPVSGADPPNAAGAALAKDLAMQVAAANPTYIGRNDVPAQGSAREKSIYREQAKASGKPDKIRG